MSTKEQHGAKGSMGLKRDWEETSGGEKEYFDDAKLEASEDGMGIILIEQKGVKDFRKSPYLPQKRTLISVEKLIELISKHGTRL